MQASSLKKQELAITELLLEPFCCWWWFIGRTDLLHSRLLWRINRRFSYAVLYFVLYRTTAMHASSLASHSTGYHKAYVIKPANSVQFSPPRSFPISIWKAKSRLTPFLSSDFITAIWRAHLTYLRQSSCNYVWNVRGNRGIERKAAQIIVLLWNSSPSSEKQMNVKKLLVKPATTVEICKGAFTLEYTKRKGPCTTRSSQAEVKRAASQENRNSHKI